MTPLPRWIDVGLLPAINLLLALVTAGIVVVLIGENPFRVLQVLISGAFSAETLGYTLYYATNVLFTGLAAAVAFQARLFSIGAEGQATLGGLGVGLACLLFDPTLPPVLVVVIACLAAPLFGAAWALVPGVLQAWRGSHVVITTIMFNFLASGLMVWLLSGPLKQPGRGSPQTRRFAEDAALPYLHDLFGSIGIARSPLNVSIVIALLAAAGVWVLVWRTRFGFALRALGHSREAARYAGIPIRRMIVITLLISGALAGGMALNEILGVQHKLILNFSAGYGFTGIAVALMGRNHPVGICAASLLFGALFQGGAELNFEFDTITTDLVLVIQGLIILFSGALAGMFTPWMTRLVLSRAVRDG